MGCVNRGTLLPKQTRSGKAHNTEPEKLKISFERYKSPIISTLYFIEHADLTLLDQLALY